MIAMTTEIERAAHRMEHLARTGTPSLERARDEGLARFLGWFSIGLGLTELLAPAEFNRLIGVPHAEANRSWTRLLGAREVAAGVGILTRPRPAGWLWARVAGDAMDLACLGKALTAPGSDPARLIAATTAVAGVMALDAYSGLRHGRRAGGGGG